METEENYYSKISGTVDVGSLDVSEEGTHMHYLTSHSGGVYGVDPWVEIGVFTEWRENPQPTVYTVVSDADQEWQEGSETSTGEHNFEIIFYPYTSTKSYYYMYWDGELQRSGLVGLDNHNNFDASHEAFAEIADDFQSCGDNTFKNMDLFYYDGYEWWSIEWNSDVPTVDPVNDPPMYHNLQEKNDYYWLTTWISN